MRHDPRLKEIEKKGKMRRSKEGDGPVWAKMCVVLTSQGYWCVG
jgi:hypothetical protein